MHTFINVCINARTLIIKTVKAYNVWFRSTAYSWQILLYGLDSGDRFIMPIQQIWYGLLR